MEQLHFRERQCVSGEIQVWLNGSLVTLKRAAAQEPLAQLELNQVEPDLAMPFPGLVPGEAERFRLLALEELSREETAQLHLGWARSTLEQTKGLHSHPSGEESAAELADTVSRMEDILDKPLAAWSEEERFGFAVYTDEEQYLFIWGSMQKVLRKLIPYRVIYTNVRLNPTELAFEARICVSNPYGVELGATFFKVGELMREAEPFPLVEELPTIPQLRASARYKRIYSMPMSEILAQGDGQDSKIRLEGNPCTLLVMVNGYPVRFPMRMAVNALRTHSWQKKHSGREVWLPVASTYVGGYSFHVRRSMARTFIFVKRKEEPVEHTAWYRFIESKSASFLLFHLGRAAGRLPGRKKNALFFEKFASKAEEGTFELCQMCAKSKKTNCWYIIDENAPDYQRIKDDPCTVRKYSLKYYWLIYNASYYIASEAPVHLNIFNSHNYYLRWCLMRRPFVFLQHGITYMKRQGNTSTFLKGRAGEAKYIVVSSEKERQVVAHDFQIDPKNIWVTGMLMFDHCAYGHIRQDSPDKVTVMLTWKPYEANLGAFEESSYYRFTAQVYQLLLRFVDRSQINIVAHPHAYEGLKKTPMGEVLWDRPISEVLEQTKLLITDYSSVCWNTFYQGGGVVFFQPDLEEYEASVGKLIPEEDEYIGYRVFDLAGLEEQLRKGVRDSRVDLDYFRSEQFQRVYESINEFHDGRNTERIYKKLKSNGFI